MYIIGIDGGGTKTKALLFHKKQGIITTLVDEASNPHSTSFEKSTDTVIRMIEKMIDLPLITNDQYICVSMGIAGLGRETDKQKWESLFQRKFAYPSKIKEVIIENDALIALYAGTYGADGIVSICGTGSITYGVNKQNSARIGGWGHLVGADRGSGYYIGYQALKAVFNSFDGMAPKTKITTHMLEGESISKVTELIPIIYGSENEKDKIASFAKYIFSSAEIGDEIARMIINNTTNDIVEFGRNLYEKLFSEYSENKSVPFILAGGVFNNPSIVEHITTSLLHSNVLKVKRLENHPVVGSIVVSLKRQGYSAIEIKELIMAP